MASATKRVQAAAGVLERSGGRRELTTPFMSWKSRVIQMAPLKHLDGLVQRGWAVVSASAKLPPSLLLLKIPPWLFWRIWPRQSARLQNPRRHPLNRACKRAMPRGRRRPSAEEIKRCGKVVHAFHAMFVNQCSLNAPWLALALQVAVQDAANSQAS